MVRVAGALAYTSLAAFVVGFLVWGAAGIPMALVYGTVASLVLAIAAVVTWRIGVGRLDLGITPLGFLLWLPLFVGAIALMILMFVMFTAMRDWTS